MQQILHSLRNEKKNEIITYKCLQAIICICMYVEKVVLIAKLKGLLHFLTREFLCNISNNKIMRFKLVWKSVTDGMLALI